MNIAKKRNRIVAFIVDATLYFIIFIIFGIFFGVEKSDGNGFNIVGFPALVLFFISLFLWPLSESFSGQTIGKRLVGLKVVNESFKEIKTRQAILRFLFAYIDLGFFLVGLFVASSNKQNQRIGDLVAKTVVIDLNEKQT
jgi:uncharacterized RDD family membrane protein YckC